MPSFPLLDIAIGLVFIYLLLSLICTSLSEALESLLRNRANDLETGIRNMLGDNIHMMIRQATAIASATAST